MRETISELWIQKCIETTLRYVVLCVLTLATRKLQVVCRRCSYRTTPLLSEMYIFFVEDGFEIQMASSAFKHASQSLSDRPFLRIQCSLTLSLKISGLTWMFSKSNECYIIRHILCVFQSCTRDSTRELRPETPIGRFLIRVTVYVTNRVCACICYEPISDRWPVIKRVGQLHNRSTGFTTINLQSEPVDCFWPVKKRVDCCWPVTERVECCWPVTKRDDCKFMVVKPVSQEILPLGNIG